MLLSPKTRIRPHGAKKLRRILSQKTERQNSTHKLEIRIILVRGFPGWSRNPLRSWPPGSCFCCFGWFAVCWLLAGCWCVSTFPFAGGRLLFLTGVLCCPVLASVFCAVCPGLVSCCLAVFLSCCLVCRFCASLVLPLPRSLPSPPRASPLSGK